MLKLALTFQPLTNANWPDMVALFQEHGPQNGCWCMYWRVARDVCRNNFGEGNRRMLQALVKANHITGILAYQSGEPVGWCSIAPRVEYPVLDRSPSLKRIDDRPVWSLMCFFVSKPYRRRGMTYALIQAALDFARQNGADVVEAYPLANDFAKTQPFDMYTGLVSTFEKMGFYKAAARSERRTIYRYEF